MKLPCLFFVLCAALAAAGVVPAPVLLELFTSEGCSSCPPADQLLRTLDQRQPFPDVDLIVLSEHVDYWNGGGWHDPYSSPLFTARQSRYAQHFAVEDIYTPQRVIDGAFEGVGSNESSIQADVQKAAAVPKVSIMLSSISRAANRLQFHISVAAPASGMQAATLFIALALDKAQSNVARGENAGHSLYHVAVARTLVPIASLQGGHPFAKDLTLNIPGGKPSLSPGIRLIAFLQVDKTDRIIGVTQAKR